MAKDKEKKDKKDKKEENPLRKIKEVNGWRINHPHSAPNIAFAIITFVLACFPLAIFFIPSIWTPSVSQNGLDLIKYMIEYFKDFSNYIANKGSFPNTNTVIAGVITGSGDVMSGIMPYVFLGLGFFVCLFILHSVLFLVYSIVHLSKGYLKHTGVVKAFAVLEFILVILYILVYVFIMAVFKIYSSQDLCIWFTFIFFGLYLGLLITINVLRTINFKTCILESELEWHEEQPVVEHVTKVHEVTKVNYEHSSTLPPNLTTIGGHAFAENQYLEIANIPPEVTKIGPSAFANCLKLQVVTIPNTVTEIGFNAFFNCINLERINFAGTKEEWKLIKRGSNWLTKAGTSEIVCTDGVVVVNPYH